MNAGPATCRQLRVLRRPAPLALAAVLIAGAPLSGALANVTLSQPANGTTVTLRSGTQTGSALPRITGQDRFRVVLQRLTFTWTARDITASHFMYGCIQRTANFDNNRYECNDTVLGWSGNSAMRAYSLDRESLRSEAGQTLYWSVRNCYPFRYGNILVQERRHVCTRWPTPRSLRVAESRPITPNTATWDAIRPAFQAASCTSCHAIGTTTGSFTNQLAQVAAVVPYHPTSSSVSSCTACHSSALVRQGLPADILDIAWRTAPDDHDFRGKNSAQLCQMAKDVPPSAPSAQDHLRRDPLILWAVRGGAYPTTGRADGREQVDNAPSAFPAGVNAWRSAVSAWVGAGMPCP